MNTARTGREREHRAAAHLAKHGFRLVMRAAGSKGSADLLVTSPIHGAALVQVGGPTKTLGPAARARLLADASDCGALALLVTPVTGVGWHVWHVTDGTPATWLEHWTGQP